MRLHPPSPPPPNLTPQPSTPPSVVVRQRSALDLKLYDFAVELFEKRYARMLELNDDKEEGSYVCEARLTMLQEETPPTCPMACTYESTDTDPATAADDEAEATQAALAEPYDLGLPSTGRRVRRDVLL